MGPSKGNESTPSTLVVVVVFLTNYKINTHLSFHPCPSCVTTPKHDNYTKTIKDKMDTEERIFLVFPHTLTDGPTKGSMKLAELVTLSQLRTCFCFCLRFRAATCFTINMLEYKIPMLGGLKRILKLKLGFNSSICDML